MILTTPTPWPSSPTRWNWPAAPTPATPNKALLDLAVAGDDGLHWDGPASVETTGYALLALLERGDAINAANAARWLATRRNAFGGYGSTQDTVVGLQGLIEYAAQARFDVDMTVDLAAGDWSRQVAINAANADVVQIVELPDGADLQDKRRRLRPGGDPGGAAVQYAGSGAAGGGNVPRSTLSTAPTTWRLTTSLKLRPAFAFTPPASPGPAPDAGMVVLDVAVPTGFAPVTDTVAALVDDNAQVKRYEIAGRKVILYLEDRTPGEELELRFDARAQYPVRAQGVTSQAYSYYTPHWRGETLGESVTVSGN